MPRQFAWEEEEEKEGEEEEEGEELRLGLTIGQEGVVEELDRTHRSQRKRE